MDFGITRRIAPNIFNIINNFPAHDMFHVLSYDEATSRVVSHRIVSYRIASRRFASHDAASRSNPSRIECLLQNKN